MEAILEKDVEVVVDSISDVITTGTVEVDVVDNTDLAVSVNRKEFNIVGDELYIPKRYEDAPQWLRDLISTVTEESYARKITDLNNLSTSLKQLIVELDVAKNTYTQSIISSNDINERINTAVTTLNSSLSKSDATIVDLISTKATPEEASAIALNTISSSINDGEIGALVGAIKTTLTTETGALANDIDVVHAEVRKGFEGTADAIQITRAYVGIDENGGTTGTGLLADISILQKQNDGVIETIAGTDDVMLGVENPNNNTGNDELDVTKEPYKRWRDADAIAGGIENRAMHVGDVYIKYSSSEHGYKTYEKAYKFIRTSVDATSPYSTDAEGFTWALIVDTDAQNAYVAALNALDLADNKRRVFTTTPSGPYDEGDLWVKEVNGSNQVWKCHVTRKQLNYYNAADWSIASTDDTATVALKTGLADGTVTVKLTNAYVGTTPFLTYLTNEIDSKVGVYSGENAPVNGQPSGVAVNDIYLWFTTTSKELANGTTQVYDITKTYKYSGSVWEEITTDSNITALADLADGKRTVFSGNTVPVGAVENDIWIPSATNGAYLQGEIYQYDGASWVIATKYSSDIAALSENIQTQLDGKIMTTYGGATPPIPNQTEFGPKSANKDDYWYCDTNGAYEKGKVYKYEETEGTGAYSGKFKYTWKFSSDISREAFDLADGKSAIFTTESKPSVYSKNDMMIVVETFNNGTTNFSDGVVLTATADSTSFVAAHWVKKINDTEALNKFVNVTYEPKISMLETQIDSQINYFYNHVATTTAQVTTQLTTWKSTWTTPELKAAHHGDIGIFTKRGTGGEAYAYSRKTDSWVLITDNAILKALMSSANAQATADGVVVSYYAIRQKTQPDFNKLWFHKVEVGDELKYVLQKYKESSWVNVDVKQGDTLTTYDTATKDTSIYLYNSDNWITEIENGIVASSEAITTLTSNLADTDFKVGGHTDQLSTVDARIADGVASVETKWAYNSTVKINGVSYSSGFGLATSLTSGSGLPTGQSEFWIKADKFKLMSADGLKKSSYSPFTVDSVTGEINFNGKVTFSNVTGRPVINKTYVQTSQPTSDMNTGDTWIDTNDNNSLYTYNGTSWIKTQSGAKTYLQTTAPTSGMIVGDIWVDSDDNYKQYRYNGSSWVVLAYNPATAINKGTTTIDGPKITTGSITANQVNLNDLFAQNITYTGVITGGNVAGGGIIQSYNGKMKIDLVNGSIYIQ